MSVYSNLVFKVRGKRAHEPNEDYDLDICNT